MCVSDGLFSGCFINSINSLNCLSLPTTAGNTLACVCVGVCVCVHVCVAVRKLPVFFITVKHTRCVCVGVQKYSALRCVRKQHVAF